MEGGREGGIQTIGSPIEFLSMTKISAVLGEGGHHLTILRGPQPRRVWWRLLISFLNKHLKDGIVAVWHPSSAQAVVWRRGIRLVRGRGRPLQGGVCRHVPGKLYSKST